MYTESHLYNKKCDLRFLLPLFHVGKFFSLSPCYDSSNGRFYLRKIQKCYALLLLALVIVLNVIYLKERMDLYSVINTTHGVVDVLSSATTYCVNFVSLMSTNFWNSEEYVGFLNTFLEVDKMIAKLNSQSANHIYLHYIELLMIHIAIPLLMVTVYLYFGITTFETHRFYLVEIVQRYQSLRAIIIMYNLITLLRYRFKIINRMIFKFCSKFERDAKYVNRTSKESFYATRYIESVVKIYVMLSEQVETFNTVFGWIVFFLTFYSVSSNLLFISNLFMNKESSFVVQIDVMLIFWILLTLSMVIMISSACDMTAKEAERTGNICYIALHQVKSKKIKEEDVVSEELLLLAKQAIMRCPCFSAAGFFRVDYTWLFTIINTVCSYVIIIVQFNKGG